MTEEILAVIGNVIRIKRDTLGSVLFSELDAELTRDNPQYHMIERMKRRNPSKYAYTKIPPKTIKSLFHDDETVYIPRGCRSLLIEKSDEHDRRIRWIDERVSFPRDPEMKLADHITLLPYQRSNLADPIIRECGIIEMPCGGGKTVFGIALAMILAQPTLILVHTHDLMNQWCRELADKAVCPNGVGIVGAGQKSARSVTVATVQTLTRMQPGALRALLAQFSCVILDECHHCPATTFLGIMNLSPAKYRYGLTATRKRKDGLHFLMHDTIGPIVASIDDDDLTSAGRTQQVHVIKCNTTFESEHSDDDWARFINDMSNDSDRNSLIISNVIKCWNDGHFPLILSDRVGHCQMIASRLRVAGMNAHALVSSVPKPQRDKIIELARKNLIDAIVATQLADEGLDIPSLSCLHLTTPTSNEAKIKQRVGRIRRPIEGKVSVIYDYVDSRIKRCCDMSRNRNRYYTAWGFTIDK